MAKVRHTDGPGSKRQVKGPDWLGSPEAVSTIITQAAAAGREWSFGWVQLASHATIEEVSALLRGTGTEIVGGAGRFARARLPADERRLAMIASLPEIEGFGAPPPAVKLRSFGDDAFQGVSGGAIPVFVTLMADDDSGHWRRTLGELGAVVGGYDADLRAYRAIVTEAQLGAVAAADFVLDVRRVRVVRAAHDTAVPAMGADALRSYAAPGIFTGTGGASIPVGVVDSGLNIEHLDIATHRDSICGANFIRVDPRDRPQEADLWFDEHGHGTHVTGTFVGNGAWERRFAGMAPSVRHIRIAKALNIFGLGNDDTVNRSIDYLAQESGCGNAGTEVASNKPLIVNMSLSADSPDMDGRGVAERKLDSAVWTHGQLYVISQANTGIRGYSEYAAAKNSLAVGAAIDSGDVAYFSSRGPTVDGRLAPNLTGTGVAVISAKGAGSRNEYARLNGTSMAAPSVAGIAALLMDGVPAHRGHPALTRAKLMATAIRPDAWLADATMFPTNNSNGPGEIQALHGLGKASARTSTLDRDADDGWTSGSATADLGAGEYASQEIVVPEGTSRLDLVLTWDEPPAEAIAEAVINDLDLWLDQGGDCETAACGEHVSASAVDNVEWIIVPSPQAGTYTAKVVAERVHSAAPRAGLAWTIIRGPSTPTLSVSSDTTSISGEGTHELVLTLSTDGYVASGTRLHIDCQDGAVPGGCDHVDFVSMAVAREDRVSVDLTEDMTCVNGGSQCRSTAISLGGSLPVGEVGAGESQQVTFQVAVNADASARLHFAASAWNANTGSTSVSVGTGAPDDPARPVNDDFESATAIEGESGARGLDLLGATTEPGEPALWQRVGDREPPSGTRASFDYLGRPAGSVWYTWTAPSAGVFRFGLPSIGTVDGGRYDRIDVFVGNAISSLERMASGTNSAFLLASKGTVYRIRIANYLRGTSLELAWERSAGPVNDSFADATELMGERGTVVATTQGATLERGEWLPLAATTWFVWTAPMDHDMVFRVLNPSPDGPVAAVFQGEAVDSLRVVSGSLDGYVVFPAGEGMEYKIVVGHRGAYEPTTDYELVWYRVGNLDDTDRFASAGVLANTASHRDIGIRAHHSVEPGEPIETGVRTAWWVWEAPDNGLFTWRLTSHPSFVPGKAAQLSVLSAFTKSGNGESGVSSLEHLGGTEIGGAAEIRIDAAMGEQYWFAHGMPVDSAHALTYRDVFGRLVWGSTPANDTPTTAATLSGVSGSVSGTNRHASSDRWSSREQVGRSTVWWSYEAPATGWIRFSVTRGPWVLTVHGDGEDGGLEILASSRWQRSVGTGTTELLFNATAGTTYTIALGVPAARSGDDFTLSWEAADAPAWLHLARRVADGDRNSTGTPVEMRGLGRMAIHASGTPLYVGSQIGLQVFARNESGALDWQQLVDGDFERSVLAWDATRDRLLVEECGEWKSYTPNASGGLNAAVSLTVADEPGRCGVDLILPSDALSIYRVGDGYIDLYSVDDAGTIGFERAHEAVGLKRAVMANAGGHVYASADDRLLAFEVHASSGVLTKTDHEPSLQATARAIAIADDDSRLFVLDDAGGERTSVYGLTDPTDPRYLGSTRRFWEAPRSAGFAECLFADVRADPAVMDAVCDGMAFTVKWHESDQRVEGTDYLAPWQPDRQNTPIPDFGVPVHTVASPGGQNLYVTTSSQEILAFGRNAPRADDDDGDPDLAILSQWAGTASPFAGSRLTLNAVIWNQGNGASPATTMRFYQSDDATIETTDAEVGSTTVGGLDVSATRAHSIAISAPMALGDYHYGMCVAAVADESDTTDNCSASIPVSVIEDPRKPDLTVVSPAVDPPTVEVGGSFSLRATVDNRGTSAAGSTTVRYFRSVDSVIDPGDAEVGTGMIVGLGAGASDTVSVELVAPSERGTFSYGVCVDPVPRESDSTNNCSPAVNLTTTVADLVVSSLSASSDPVEGESFTLDAVVGNEGDASSAATTLRYYRSEDSEISADDTEVGESTVPSMPGGSSIELSVDVVAPSEGTYYYGACVDSVPNESATSNNCSLAARVTVSVPASQACEVELRRASDQPAIVTLDPAQLEDIELTDAATEASPKVVEGTLGGGDDFDGYRIAVDSDLRLYIKAEGVIDSQGALVRDDCTNAGNLWNDAEWHDDYASGDYEVYVIGNLSAGTYYLAVGTWSGSAGDYTLKLWQEVQPANEPPEIRARSIDLVEGERIFVYFGVADDDGDWIVSASAVSADESVLTVDFDHYARNFYDTEDGGRVLLNEVYLLTEAVGAGDTTVDLTVEDQRGASSTSTLDFTVTAASGGGTKRPAADADPGGSKRAASQMR